MAVNYNILNFYSGSNYMKRSDKSGNRKISSGTVSASHNLGYVPNFLYYVDLDNDGMLWYGGEKVNDYTGTAFDYTRRVDAWIDTTKLTFDPSYITSNRDVYYIFYLDYGSY